MAFLIAHLTGLPFVPFSAVTAGIKEVKAVIQEAERQKRLSKEVRMKKVALLCLVAFALSVVTAPSAWAKECPKVHKEVMELIGKAEKAKMDPKKIEDWKKRAAEGLKLHEAGKHDDSLKILKPLRDEVKKAVGA